MNADANGRTYLDTSALAKWYFNEEGSEDFVSYLQGLDVAVVSSLTRTEDSRFGDGGNGDIAGL